MPKFHKWALTDEEEQLGVFLSRSWDGNHVVIESENDRCLTSRIEIRLVDLLEMLRDTRQEERPRDEKELYERWLLTKNEIR